MKKYNAVKPIHSTELGLNSQGQTRRAVALSMIKKFTSFFAEGGETVSWFTIQYPDPKGRARGQFGDAHCIFDCKYNLYNPRLDAIAHYYMLNSICDKKFVEEKHYSGNAQAYLFRDQRAGCLQVLWLDGDRRDVTVPLPAGERVELVRLGGERTILQSTAEGVVVTLSDEPTLLLYKNGERGLAPALKPAALSLKTAPVDVAPGGNSTLVLEGPGLAAESLRVECPPRWKTALKKIGGGQFEVTLDAPTSTAARQVRVYVQLVSDGKPIGELSVPLPVNVRGLRSD